MPQSDGFLRKAYDWLGSLKLTVFVFLILAGASVIGTLLPQYDVYHTFWFQLLLLLLCVNLTVCSLQRLPKTLKLIRKQEESINPQKLVKFTYNQQFSTRLPFPEVQSKLQAIISESFGPPMQVKNAEGAFAAIVDKASWSRLMVYVVHASVLFILIGALIGSIWGFKGFMAINEGDTTGEVMLATGNQSIELPFQVRCDDFDVTFYDTGMPKEFRSELAIIDQGREVLKQSIIVNDPLSYGGITFYQSSYGTSLKRVDLQLRDEATGKTINMTAPLMEMTPIPGTDDWVQVMQYHQDFRGFGPVLFLRVMKASGESSMGRIIVNMPDFHGNKVFTYQVKVLDAQPVQYTGLQVKKDPGIWVVYIGFMAMLIGIGLTFYTSHRKLYVWAMPGTGAQSQTKVILAGRTSKNPLAFEREFNELGERLKNQLQSSEKRK